MWEEVLMQSTSSVGLKIEDEHEFLDKKYTAKTKLPDIMHTL